MCMPRWMSIYAALHLPPRTCVCLVVCACMHGRLCVCGVSGKVSWTESESRFVAAGPRALRLREEERTQSTADSC